MTAPTTAAPPSSRALGACLIAASITLVGLLALHPGGAPATFADVLKTEASQQLQSAIVHGGGIALLAVQLAALAVLATRLGVRAPVVVGMTLSAVGFGFLASSLTVDGLVIPAIASRYLAAPPAALPSAKALFVLIGSLVRFLMPMGLAAQAVAALAWGWALWGSVQPRRIVGGLAMLVGALVLAALAVTAKGLDPNVVMVGFLGNALWLTALGASLVRRPV